MLVGPASRAGHAGSILSTAHAAPKPLSIPTTVRPAAHDDSMDSRAVTPSKAAPYPVLVGTAITGAGVMPPTMLARAPSMPATTTTASAPASSSTVARRRWTPATPTSAFTEGCSPWATRVATHSSVTGRSEVPAVNTTTRPGQGGAGLGLRRSGEQDRPPVLLAQQLGHDGPALLRRLPGPVHRLGQALA